VLVRQLPLAGLGQPLSAALADELGG